jgi:hypothetical protein
MAVTNTISNIVHTISQNGDRTHKQPERDLLTCYICVFVIIHNNNNNRGGNRNIGYNLVSLKQLLFLSQANRMHIIRPCYPSTGKYWFPLTKFCNQTDLSQFPCLVESSVEYFFHSLVSFNRQVSPLSTPNFNLSRWKNDVKKLSKPSIRYCPPQYLLITPTQPFLQSHRFWLP